MARPGWQDGGMSEQAGRYQRSSSGLIGAMLVLLLVIGAFLGLRAISRDNQATPVQAVDYVAVMEQARNDGGMIAPAPDPMPQGWRATSVRYTPGAAKAWHLGMLTDTGKYVGIEEASRSAREMVDEYLGKDATRGRPTTIRTRTWQTWSEPGGDYAITLTTPHETVLVGGSASRTATLDFTDRLAMPRLQG
jgi:hypothetical protein